MTISFGDILLFEAVIVRTLVDIPDKELALLNQMSREQGISRAELVRCAIARFLEPRIEKTTAAAFGLWADRDEDGVAYQKRMRREWPE